MICMQKRLRKRPLQRQDQVAAILSSQVGKVMPVFPPRAISKKKTMPRATIKTTKRARGKVRRKFR